MAKIFKNTPDHPAPLRRRAARTRIATGAALGALLGTAGCTTEYRPEIEPRPTQALRAQSAPEPVYAEAEAQPKYGAADQATATTTQPNQNPGDPRAGGQLPNLEDSNDTIGLADDVDPDLPMGNDAIPKESPGSGNSGNKPLPVIPGGDKPGKPSPGGQPDLMPMPGHGLDGNGNSGNKKTPQPTPTKTKSAPKVSVPKSLTCEKIAATAGMKKLIGSMPLQKKSSYVKTSGKSRCHWQAGSAALSFVWEHNVKSVSADAAKKLAKKSKGKVRVVPINGLEKQGVVAIASPMHSKNRAQGIAVYVPTAGQATMLAIATGGTIKADGVAINQLVNGAAGVIKRAR